MGSESPKSGDERERVIAVGIDGGISFGGKTKAKHAAPKQHRPATPAPPAFALSLLWIGALSVPALAPELPPAVQTMVSDYSGSVGVALAIYWRALDKAKAEAEVMEMAKEKDGSRSPISQSLVRATAAVSNPSELQDLDPSLKQSRQYSV